MVWLGKKENRRLVCPKTGKRISSGRWNWWLVCLFPLIGLASLIWFLIRVLPKPSRAAYPCQRVAMPLASGVVVWLTGTVGAAFAYRQGKLLYRKSKLYKALICFAAAVVVGLIAFVNMPEKKSIAVGPVQHLYTSMGLGKGIYPGRVVWIHDPNATDWGGTNYDGEDIGYGYW